MAFLTILCSHTSITRSIHFFRHLADELMSRIDFPLYLITDRHQTFDRTLNELIDLSLSAGLRAVQLREKDLDTRPLLRLGQEILGLARKWNALLIINDRIDLTLALGADGVHLRAESLPVATARRLLGPDRLIGVSTHSVEEAVTAGIEGADFAVLGPIYDTPSKRSYGSPIGLRPLEEASGRCAIPIFAIGGITASRIPDVLRAGAFGVAVVSAILSAHDAQSATRCFLRTLAEHTK